MTAQIQQQTAVAKKVSLVETMALEYGLEPDKFVDIVKATVMPTKELVSNAHIAAFLQVAHTYKLNPFFKEIYAFPAKSGGIQPIVSVDGWLAIANRDPRFDGYDYQEIRDDQNKLEGGQITIYLKGRERPFVHREWFAECKRPTDPWNQMPRRMMENRTTVQGLRRALGIHGIVDPDEFEQMNEINITAQSSVLERATENKTADLKEKIGAKKSTPAPKAQAQIPNKEPEINPVAEPDPPAEQPAEVIEPQEQEPVEVKATITDQQRSAFLKLAQEQAIKLGWDEQQTKTKLREIIFAAGFTKLAEVTADCYQVITDSVKAWE